MPGPVSRKLLVAVTFFVPATSMAAENVPAGFVAIPALEALLPPEPALPQKLCVSLEAHLAQAQSLLPDAVDADPANSQPDAKRLQEAMDQCSAKGGGGVKLVASGANNAFLAGPLKIPSNVLLWVDSGVTLFASRSPVDYDAGGGNCGDALPSISTGCNPWITATNTSNAGIVGDGAVDGRGGSVLTSGRRAGHATWWDLSMQSKASPPLSQNNPRMIQVMGGSNFTLYRISIQNAPKFHVVTTDVNRVTVWGVKVMTPTLAYSVPGYACAPAALPAPEKTTTPSTCFQPEVTKNTDGIDPGTSRDVTIAYSYISTGDDQIALKSGRGPNGKTWNGAASTNHLYAHNRFYYGHGISIGSETDAGVDGVKIWDVVSDGQDNPNGVGLRIKSDASRGGVVQNVLFQNVCMRRIRDAIVVSPYYESAKSTALPPDFHGITMKDIHYVNADSKFNRSQLTFSGYQSGEVTLPLGITLDNVVFDTPAVLRKGAPNHDVQFKLGPGPVVGVPLDTNATISRSGTPGTTPASVDCGPGAFVKFPAATSPI